GEGAVVLQGIHGVVGGADHADVPLLHDAAGAEARTGELLLGLLPDALGGAAVEEAVADPEGALELQVGPVVERVAQALGDGLGPGLELLALAGIAGAEALGHTVAAHGAPLVVVALEPDLGQVGVAAVAGDLGGVQVAVVVDDGQLGGVVVVEAT